MTDRLLPHNNGKLHLIFGPMFSGKTSELLRRIRRYQLCNYKCLLIRYSKDVRYSDKMVVTHSGLAMNAAKTAFLENVCQFAEESEIIGIDEGQFFPDLLPFCQKQINQGKVIIVAGLDATYLRTGFDNILQLVPLAHSVEKLSAVCMSCGDKASFSKRIVDESEIEVIGGADKYMAVCRQCYKIPRPEKSSPFRRMDQIPKHLNVLEDPVCRKLFMETS
ncbi:hypothetical protein GE061_005296 [Apolygus lucorum]|uniref:Thymidine kinase n=1 Tax=Apolygus lucorum TaxID=248454 RepID=A0A8S9WXA1_APOLU|nr:hypothetical protein GE061_005296 [Apolygus lucorum]